MTIKRDRDCQANEVLTEWHYMQSGTRSRDYIYAGGRLISAVDRVTTLPGGCGGEARPDGTAIPITISTPGGSASVTFEGSGCRRASVVFTKTSGNIGCFSIEVRLVSTNALVGSSGTLCAPNGFLEPVTLPNGGEYRVTLTTGTGTGTATIQIYDVVDVAMPIAANGVPVPVDLLTPGQNTRLPFTGTGGQRVSVLVNVASGGFGCWGVEIWRKSPSSRVSPAYSTCASAGSGFLEPFELPATDEYEVVVNPSAQNTGSAAVHLYTVVDLMTPITADGTAVPIDLTVPGRKTRLRFSGVQGQRISALVTVTSGSFGCWPLEIWSVASNTPVIPQYGLCGSPRFLEPLVLPATGEYEVVADPSQSNTGTGTARLYTVTDVTGSITPGGVATPLALPVPGQMGTLTFTGTETYKATINVNGNFGCWTLTLVQPNNSALQSFGGCGVDFWMGPVTLPSGGTYTILVDPYSSGTGTATARLWLVP